MTELRRWREKRGLSQEILAGMSDVSRPAIHRIEHGQQKPRKNTIRKLARVLKVEPEEVAPELFKETKDSPTGIELTNEIYQKLEPYISQVANRRARNADEAEELAGMGREGLMEACRKYDPTKENSMDFERWAKFYINNRIQNEAKRLFHRNRESYLDDVLPVEWEGDIPVYGDEEDE